MYKKMFMDNKIGLKKKNLFKNIHDSGNYNYFSNNNNSKKLKNNKKC